MVQNEISSEDMQHPHILVAEDRPKKNLRKPKKIHTNHGFLQDDNPTPAIVMTAMAKAYLEKGMSHLNAARVYIDDPSLAPPGYQAEEGPKGGWFYESDGRESAQEESPEIDFSDLSSADSDLLRNLVEDRDLLAEVVRNEDPESFASYEKLGVEKVLVQQYAEQIYNELNKRLKEDILETTDEPEEEQEILPPLNLRTIDRGLWGSSHSESTKLSYYASKVMGIDGYRQPESAKPLREVLSYWDSLSPERKKEYEGYDLERDSEYNRIVTGFLSEIVKGEPSDEPLYHGFANRANIQWNVGDTLALSLTATSGDIDNSAAYGRRLDPRDQVGEVTVFSFPVGLKMAGYGRWNSSDVKEFGYKWREALTQGKFKIAGLDTHHDVKVVKLEQTHIFDPEKGWLEL